MTARLTHRGPDGEGYWVDGSIGFGHRRLSIIDVAGSPQPMATADERAARHLQRRDLQLPRAPRRVRLPVPHQRRHRGAARAATSARAPGRSSGCAASSPTPSTTATTCGCSATASACCPLFTYQRRRPVRVRRPRSRRCCRPCRPRPAVDLASLDSYLSRRAVAAPHTLFENVRKLLPGHRLRVGPDGRYRARALLDGARPAPPRRCRRRRGRASWSPPGSRTRSRSALVADVPGGLAAERRGRQQPDRGPGHQAARGRAGRHVLGRLR